MEKSKKTDAMKHCANWNAGKCLGVIMFRKDGKLLMNVDKKLADKECCVDSGCEYFDSIVVPGME
tara:strand:+ start:681 stop:875 length:195 start_codon:yes stop_codon:yes gene_type:complete